MRSLKTLLTASLIVSALLTGCSDKNSDITVDTGDVKTDVTVDTGDIKTDVTVDTGDSTTDADNSKNNIYLVGGQSQNTYVFDTPQEVISASVKLPNGKIVIEHSHDDKTGFALTFNLYGPSQEKIDEVRNHVGAKSDIQNGRIEISLVDPESGEDLETWLSKNAADCRIEYDTYVSVPEYVTDYSALCGVGDILFNSMKGSFRAELSIGNIEFSDVEFTGASRITCVSGEIKMGQNVYKADTDIKTDIGNISLDMPMSTSGGANITAYAKTGDICLKGAKDYTTKDEKSNVTSKSMTIEAENCNISLSTDTGKITIDKE